MRTIIILENENEFRKLDPRQHALAHVVYQLDPPQLIKCRNVEIVMDMMTITEAIVQHQIDHNERLTLKQMEGTKNDSSRFETKKKK